MSTSIVTMLDSGSTVQFDTARFTASHRALGERLADVAARRCEVGDAVDHLLRGWRGEAAAAFRGSWEAWRDGADEVIDELRRSVAALPLAQADLCHERHQIRGRLRPTRGAARVTTFDVDLDELRHVIATLAACQRALLDLGGDIHDEVVALHEEWLGRASDAHAASYGSWRDGCAEMVTALAALRGLGEAAEGNYRAAVEANLAMWEQVR